MLFILQYTVVTTGISLDGTWQLRDLGHPMGLLPDKHCGLRMRREWRERFPRHPGLAIPTFITTRAWHTYRDACRDR